MKTGIRSSALLRRAWAPGINLLCMTGLLLLTSRAPATGAWTLERAIGFALTNSPDARIAQMRITAARAGLEQADSALWPKLQLQSSYTRTDNPMLVFGSILAQRAYNYSSPPNFNDLPSTDDLNVRGIVTQPLYAGGRIAASRDVARAGSEAARADAEAVRNALAFEVSRTFLNVLKTRDFIRAAEAGLQSFQNNLVIASNRVEAGTSLRTDVLDMQVRVAQSREDLVRARNANALTVQALEDLLGIDGTEFEVADSAPTMAVPAGDDFSGRAELNSARQQQRAAEAQVRQARSGYLPRLSAFGSLDYDYGWVTGGDGQSYTAGALLQWDLWDGKLTRGRVNEARANLEAAREMERKVQLAINLEVKQARLELQSASERLAVSQASVAQAEESQTLTRSRFGQGLALSTQLIDADNALISARVRRAEAEADQRIAIAALRKALGLPQLNPAPETR